MSDTAFIFGAGFSHDAGIPLLGNFVDTMWEFAIRRKIGQDNLSPADIKIFDEVLKIRDTLDGYHGRAMFDDRNIEDILSILSFNTLGGSKADKEKLKSVSRAIARTIDLCCSVKHPGVVSRGTNSIQTSGHQVYRNFWHSVFNHVKDSKSLVAPTIITFNYDLVLERSLLQTLIGTTYGRYTNLAPFSGIRLNYHYDDHPGADYKITYVSYKDVSSHGFNTSDGSVLEEHPHGSTHDPLEINLLKLHGSLNFPSSKTAQQVPFNLTHSLEDPFILPPIFNKMTNKSPTKMWQTALDKLRSAKNIVIVGYSLPQTDIYMQYFLKAALGPNRNLNKITVFDPALFRNDDSSMSMKKRYESCFSPQLRSRIVFEPYLPRIIRQDLVSGSTEHFVKALTDDPKQIVF